MKASQQLPGNRAGRIKRTTYDHFCTIESVWLEERSHPSGTPISKGSKMFGSRHYPSSKEPQMFGGKFHSKASPLGFVTVQSPPPGNPAKQ